jgi:hypothetical protein
MRVAENVACAWEMWAAANVIVVMQLAYLWIARAIINIFMYVCISRETAVRGSLLTWMYPSRLSILQFILLSAGSKLLHRKFHFWPRALVALEVHCLVNFVKSSSARESLDPRVFLLSWVNCLFDKHKRRRDSIQAPYLIFVCLSALLSGSWANSHCYHFQRIAFSKNKFCSLLGLSDSLLTKLSKYLWQAHSFNFDWCVWYKHWNKIIFVSRNNIYLRSYRTFKNWCETSFAPVKINDCVGVLTSCKNSIRLFFFLR